MQAWLAERLQPKLSDAMTPDRVVEEVRRVTLASRMPRDANGNPLLKNWPEEVLSLIEGWELDEAGRVRKIKLTPKSKGIDLAVKYHDLIKERSVSAHLDLDLGAMTVPQIRTRLEAVMAEMGRSREGPGEDVT